MYRITCFVTLCFNCLIIISQNLIELNPTEIENLFINNNRELIIEKMEIDIADAQIAEAKIFNNPELNIGDINFWKKNSIDEYGNATEYSPQFSIELSQKINISSSRKQLIKVEKANKEVIIKEYEKLLSELKAELNVVIASILFYQKYETVLNDYNQYALNLLAGFKSLKSENEIGLEEYLRIETYQLSILDEINQVIIQKNEFISKLKSMICIGCDYKIKITSPETINYSTLIPYNKSELIAMSLDNNPDINSSEAYLNYYKKDIAYMSSLAVPDLNVSIKYDRYGGVWKNFYGIGLGIDLPIYNRNKSGKKIAQIKYNQNSLLKGNIENIIINEVSSAYDNYVIYNNFYNSIISRDLYREFNNISTFYMNSLFEGNFTLLEIIDFLDSYKDNYEILFKTELEMSLLLSKIEYLIGGKIKNNL